VLKLFFIACLISWIEISALAYEGYPRISKFQNSSATPKEIFDRTEAILNYYQVPEEKDPTKDLLDVQNVQTLDGLKKILPYMDPSNVFARLSTITQNDLTVFQDLDSKEVLDTRVNLKPHEEETIYHIGDPSSRTPQFPLNGLRIALDPGHMGGTRWDKFTGKYIQDSQGRIVSEGTTVLQISLLLKQELEKLGAKVLLTREGLRPVTQDVYESFDLLPHALLELRENSHQPWFLNLVRQAPIGQKLFQLFDNSSDVKNIFSEKQRAYYYIFRSDLAARAELINNFQPDIALVIHLDTANKTNSDHGTNPQAPYETKTFVMGSYEPNEFASRADRKYFVRHLLDAKSWNLSLNLGRNITHSFRDRLGLKLSQRTGGGWTLVEPGIISRNLGVTRRLQAPAVSYLECLFYNRPDEFNKLAQTKHPMLIDGENIPYSERVVEITNSIKEGLLKFAREN